MSRMTFPLLLSCAALLLAGCATKTNFYLADNGEQASSVSTTNDTKGSDQFPLTRNTHGKRVFVFDPKLNAWAAYDKNGERVKTGRASGGRDFCADVGRECRTITGTYHVISKGGADCESKIFPIETHGGAPMPYCMKFGLEGHAIHGSNDVPDANASHGCIRVTPEAAQWLSENFISVGTTVVVEPY